MGTSPHELPFFFHPIRLLGVVDAGRNCL
jgi:hypothetical protein